MPAVSNNPSTAASTSRGAMVQLQQDHAAAAAATALRCPRCDSSNTKFCYYNNYSLSQPRHFCKACKRYWTRGGTLRNVPVGGGCRKNKRSKKPSSSAAATAAASTAITPSLDHPPPPLSLLPTELSSRSSDLSSLIYNLPATSSSDMNLAFPNYDILQPHLNALDLGLFPSNQSAVFGANLAELQQSEALLNDYQQFGSLLVSSLKQPKKAEDYQPLFPYPNGNLGLIKEVKEEGGYNVMGSNRIEWQIPSENPIFDASASVGAADSSYLYWNAAVGGAGWPDGANCGSTSIAPMI